MAQQGFVYEENAYTALNKKGPLKVDISTGGTAGASADKPDLTIHRLNHRQQPDGIELKISPTAAGSLVMKYGQATERWDYGSVLDKSGSDMPEKVFIQAIGESKNLLKEMNTSGTYGRNWRKHKPALQVLPNGGKCFGPGCDDIRDAYIIDIENFGGQSEIKIEVPAKAISDYYNKKKCHYLNVGTHGFFILNSDPLKLNAAMRKLKNPLIPDFGASAKCMIRVRVQDKSRSGPSGLSFQEGHLLDQAEDRTGGYQFTMTLQFSNVKTSPYNIAPIVGKSVIIDIARLKKDKLLQAWL